MRSVFKLDDVITVVDPWKFEQSWAPKKKKAPLGMKGG
jgi:hypothetical protein